MLNFLRNLWFSDEGQDLAEYAVTLGALAVAVAGAAGLLGGKGNHVFSTMVHSLQNCFHPH